MLTVACVYWKGNFCGKESSFNPEYVKKLYNMVQRNLKIPYEFVCLTNAPEEVSSYNTVLLKNDWSGWWSKVELFRKGLFNERVLYIDLDSLIIRDLDSIASYPSPFATIRTLVSFEEPSVIDEKTFRSGKARVKRGGRWEFFMYNTSVMVWDPSEIIEDIYDKFTPEVMEKYRGDQDYLADVFPYADIFPRSWVKKLKEIDNVVPDDCRVILCTPTKNEQVIQHSDLVRSIWK